jgi:large-conductance mechanosensitive channel
MPILNQNNPPILNQNVPPKEDFRNFCVSNLNYIRTFQIPSIQYGNFKEAVIVEFRIFPHVEFLIRNAIKKIRKHMELYHCMRQYKSR